MFVSRTCDEPQQGALTSLKIPSQNRVSSTGKAQEHSLAEEVADPQAVSSTSLVGSVLNTQFPSPTYIFL